MSSAVETPRQGAPVTSRITELHTLGPTGTNLETAAYEWFRRQGRDGAVHLHPTLEQALPVMPRDGSAGLVACAVYPDLHTLVFSNLLELEMVDSFVFPTWNMVLAARPGVAEITTVSTHPAPQGLVKPGKARAIVTSNSQAAIDCAAGLTDACITTLPAARRNGLRVVRDFGPVPMVYTVHWLRRPTGARPG